MMLLALAALCLPACPGKVSPGHRQYSPDQARYVELAPGAVERTQDIWLGFSGRSERLLLAEGLPGMCGVGLSWLPGGELHLRLPEPYRPHLRADARLQAQERLKVEFHQDAVVLSRESPAKKWRIIAVKNCESAAWQLHLRGSSEPNFDQRMLEGWGDASLLCAFDHRRILKSIRWLGEAEVLVEVKGPRSGATLRESASGVRIRWKFSAPKLNG